MALSGQTVPWALLPKIIQHRMPMHGATFGDGPADVFLGRRDGAGERFSKSQKTGDRGGVGATGPVGAYPANEGRGQEQLLPAIPKNIDRLIESAQMTAFDECGAA